MDGHAVRMRKMKNEWDIEVQRNVQFGELEGRRSVRVCGS